MCWHLSSFTRSSYTWLLQDTQHRTWSGRTCVGLRHHYSLSLTPRHGPLVHGLHPVPWSYYYYTHYHYSERLFHDGLKAKTITYMLAPRRSDRTRTCDPLVPNQVP